MMLLMEVPLLSFKRRWHKYHPCGKDCGRDRRMVYVEMQRLVAREEPLGSLGPAPQSLPSQRST